MKLGTIQDLYTRSGPFVTVHMDVSRNTEDAPQQMDARWTTATQDLERAGVDKDLIDRIGERLHQPTDVPGEARRTIVAADGDIVFDDIRAGHSIWPETTVSGPLPDLSGWLHQVDGQVPFVLVLADREGADIEFYRAMSKPDADRQTVEGETLHITKVPQGDWAQKQFQQRSENVWQQNAREVADAVRRLCTEQRPRLVILAGDERARAEISDALENLQCDVEQVTAGGRAPGSSTEALWDEVRQVLARIEAFDEEQVTGQLLEKTGQGSGAARGLPEVLDALVQGKAERLLIDLRAAHDMTVNPADHPGLALPASACNETELPADQVLVAVGAATDAELSVLPAEQTKGAGVAALLRWDD
ncbi:MAG TPA: Vms1/Ankzf1 family peptidyl-tRNA hydrolase [Nocardioidaceae bacterium]|nr:Vms1/Ankzf1 family peptidyl-tRNA hydrolase [Nocardioidaceae bacterium]